MLAKVPPWKFSWVKDYCLRKEINCGVFSSASFLSKPSRLCPHRDSCQEIWQNRNCERFLPQLSGSPLTNGFLPKTAYGLSKFFDLQESCCLPWDFAHMPLSAKAHPWNSRQLCFVWFGFLWVWFFYFFHFRHWLFHHSRHWRIHFTFKLNTEYGILAAE